jgi:hypothetical protein
MIPACKPDRSASLTKSRTLIVTRTRSSQRATPEHVISRAAQAAITGVVDIDTQIVKAPRYRGRDVFVEQEL